MKLVSDFQWIYNSMNASWRCGETWIYKQYRCSILSASALRDGTGVAIVEPFEDSGQNNAVVFNADGSERFRLKFPLPEARKNHYLDMYCAGGILAAFANIDGNDFRYELNEATGEVLRCLETR